MANDNPREKLADLLDDQSPFDERFITLLAIYDESLARGRDDATWHVAVPKDQQSRFEADAELLRLLEDLWPRRTSPAKANLPRSIGRSFGRFRIVRELGRGGFGVVFLAFDPLLQRRVALKLPRAEALVTPELRRRFLREAQAAGGLEHSGIVPVHETGEIDGVSYIASAYCPGGDLAEWLRRHGQWLDPRVAAALVLELAEAIQYSHDRGVLHRDLKPGNVLVVPRQEAPGSRFLEIPVTVRITDFGLAKLLEAGTGETAATTLLGTPSYMAPEQALGAGSAGSRSDVYSLGAILYELVCGQPPFEPGSPLAVLDRIRSEDPPLPRQLRPELPRDVETICLKCLRKEPHERYASASELAADLGRFYRGEPIEASGPSVRARLHKYVHRHRGPLAAAAAIFLVALLGTAASLWQAARATTAAESAYTAATRAERSEAAARRLLFAADMNLVGEALRVGDPIRAAELLDQHAEEKDGAYSFVWNHLDRFARAPGRIIDHFDGAAYCLAFSPDGRMLAAGGADGTARLYRTPHAGENQDWPCLDTIDTGQVEINGVSFTRDGRGLITSGDDRTIRLWDLASKTERWRAGPFDALAYDALFALNDSILVAYGDEPTIRLLDPATGAVLGILAGHIDDVKSAAVTPDGRMLVSVTAGDSSEAIGWDLESRSIKWRATRGHEFHSRLEATRISPDGRHVAFTFDSASVMILEVSTGALLSSERMPDQDWSLSWTTARSLAFSPDGRQLVVGFDGGLIRRLRLHDDGTFTAWEAVRPAWAADGPRVYGLHFSPDGRQVLAAAECGTLTVWRPDDDPPWQQISLVGIGSRASAVHSTPRGDRLLFADGDGLNSIDPASGHRVLLPIPVDALFASGHNERLYVTFGSRLEAWDVSSPLPRTIWRHPSDEQGQPGNLIVTAATADGKRLVAWRAWRDAEARYHRRIALLDADTGHTLAERALDEVTAFPTLTPTGTLIAFSRQDAIHLAEPQTLADLQQLGGRGDRPGAAVCCLVFSPDGSLLASAASDRRVTLWDMARGEPLRSWVAHERPLETIAFGPEGKTLLVAADGGPPRLWDVESGRLLLDWTFLRGEARADEVAWYPAHLTADGSRIIGGRIYRSVILDGRPRM